MAKFYLSILLLLFAVLLVTTSLAPEWLGSPVADGWFTWGLLLFLLSNVLAVVFSGFYLLSRGKAP